MAQQQQLDLMPVRLERGKAPPLLGGDEARVLRNVDLCWFTGRLRRGPGESLTQITPAQYTVTAAFVAVRRDCRRVVFDSDVNGTVRMTVGNVSSLLCIGPTNENMEALESEDAAVGEGTEGSGGSGT
jgi:hypothetical protein